MTECLFVVIGAGASFACASEENVKNTTMRPPLVTQLFEPRWAGILERYPMAQLAASDIRKHTSNPVKIEDFLREHYRDSGDPNDRRKFHAIHWYLQHVLWAVSNGYTAHPDNYDRLVSACLKLPHVVFITLNYDTLLDDRLRIFARRFDSLGDYTSPATNWGLVKLHGSVDWGLPIQGPAMDGQDLVFNPPPEIHVRQGIQLRRLGTNDLDAMRLEQMGSQFFYPAMSVPVGTRDEFSCPPEHVGYLRNLLAARTRGLDILLLGYSALDEEVLRLFKESGKPLRSLMAVNADEESSIEAFRRVKDWLGDPQGMNDIYERSFADFVSSDELDRYLARL